MNKATKQPPRLAQRLLHRFLDANDRDMLLGDFEEFYIERVARSGRLSAGRWYWKQVFRSFPHFIRNRVYWRLAMWSNYVKIALRNIRKQKAYSFINIFGLALGIACSLLILMWVVDELSYDTFHENRDTVFRVVADWPRNDWDGIPATPAPLLPAMMEEIPEIVEAARIVSHPRLVVRYGEKAFYEDLGVIADPDLFRMFTFPFVEGTLETAFLRPMDVVISESFADKYFGSEGALNRTLEVEGVLLTVTGVFEDIPENSHLRFEFVSSFEFMDAIQDWSFSYGTSWGSFNFVTYARVQVPGTAAAVGQKMTDVGLRNESWHVKNGLTFRLQPLRDIHLDPVLGGYISWLSVGDAKIVTLFSAVAGFVLLIACVNFMNLSTARSVLRAREVGMRKTVGAARVQLVRQFFGESFVLTSIAAVIALLFVWVFLPYFNALSGKSLGINLLDGQFILGLVVVVIVTGLIAGSYPALMLSSFKPMVVFRGMSRHSGGSGFRRLLVVFQFSLSILLIFGTSVLYKQQQFIRAKELGFVQETVVSLPIKEGIAENYETVKTELLRYPEIVSVSAQYMSMTATWRNAGWEWEGRDPNRERSQDLILSGVDYDFFETLDMEVVDGRAFSTQFPSDRESSVILNETAVREMELESPVGKWFRFSEDDVATVVGVAKDAHFQSLHREIEARIFFITDMSGQTDDGIVLIRIHPGEPQRALAVIRGVWDEVNSNVPFEYQFLDDTYARLYEKEQRTGRIFRYFTILAIVISCLGLFGLASFMAERRTKEVGIRKVMGAPVSRLIVLLSKEFARWVIVANAVAWPVGYFMMKKMLQVYAYWIPLSVDLFLLSGLLALVIAMMTVGYQALRAARANPVDSLRYE